MARCEWSGRDKVTWRVCSVPWGSKPRTVSFAQLLSFSLSALYRTGDVSAGQTDPPSWSLSLATSSVNPIDFLFMSPDEKLQRKPKGGRGEKKKKKKKKDLCIVRWLANVSDSAFTISFPPFFFLFRNTFRGFVLVRFCCLFVLFSLCQKRQLLLNLGSIFWRSQTEKKTVKKKSPT